MGVHDFTKTFEATERATTLAKLKSEDYAVDAFPELFRATSMQYAARLTNPRGEPTLHLTVALANACNRKAQGCEDVWCFDSRDPRARGDAKEKTLLTRAEIRARNVAEILRQEQEIARLEALAAKTPRAALIALDPTFDISLRVKRDELEIMRARNPDKHHFNNMIRDVLFMLERLGIQYALAPPGCDAEQLAAQLSREGVVDGVITVDTDALPYGNKKQIKKIAGRSGRYDVYSLADILQRYDITEQQLAEVASVLGCDFCAKTEGVGAKTVIRRVKEGEIEYTAEQRVAQRKFLDRRAVRYEFHDPKCTREGLRELRAWLIDVQGFKADGVDKKLAPFYPK